MEQTGATELLKKVRKIEIKTKALSHQIFAGEYHSAFKGRGMAFSEVREYRYGDNVKSIDWNVTARLRAPYVKVYEEERELTVVLLIDVSRSGLFGTCEMTKRELIAEIAAVLSFSAIINNDKVGAMFFSDKVEKFIPPKKGRSHLLHIIREIIQFRPESKGTNIGEAFRYLTNAIKKKYEDSLKVAVNRHDISVIRVYDHREIEIPDIGFINVKDSESGVSAWVNTGSRNVRQTYAQWFRSMDAESKKLLYKYNIDNVSISTGDDYVKGLMSFFQNR